MAGPVIHSLNCSTMCPRGAVRMGIVAPDPGHLVAHCLLIEGADGLILVDTGFGTEDVHHKQRLGWVRLMTGPKLTLEETAIEQIKALGHQPGDVRHIIATHLDLDHAGGLGDFPGAEVHVHRTELAEALHPTVRTRARYRTAQWEHGPKWVEHEPQQGDPWFGFDRAKLLEASGVEIAMIALHGHTHGHCGVAVNTGDGWLLHAGDAYLDHGEIATPPVTTTGRSMYHSINSLDEQLRRRNVARLAELARDEAAGVTVFCAHDAREFEQVRARNAAASAAAAPA